MKKLILSLFLVCSLGVFSQVTYTATKTIISLTTATSTVCPDAVGVRISKDYTSAIFSESQINVVIISSQVSTFGSCTTYLGHLDDRTNTEVRINIYSKGTMFYIIEYETKLEKNIYLLKTVNNERQ